ncbi:MAG: site-2 protease family protein [Firmicutes bacterium]|nr:site-2 protease family protein [Bacillota bacterium]
MRWSVDVARVAGITVRLHITFLLLLAWIAMANYFAGGVSAAVGALAFIAGIFGSVLLHELGHALAARRYGIRTADITLLPIGGVARLERLPERPAEELVVALAGPLVNVVIAAVLYSGLVLSGRSNALTGFGLVEGNLWAQLLFTNLWLALFNLVPAFPMDGGRVLRAVLAARMGFARATQAASVVGQGFAFLFVLIGFFVNPMLIFIGLFIYLGAASEASTAQLQDFAGSMPVAGVMVTDVRALYRETPLADAVEALLRGSQREFPIVDGAGRVAGLLCREDMIRALRVFGPEVPVSQVMQSGVPMVHPSEMLHRVFPRMMAGQYSALPVVDSGGFLVGLLTRDNLAEVIMVHSAMEDRRRGWGKPDGTRIR